MFTAQLPHIFTHDNLKLAFEEISKNASGLDEISYKEFKKEFSKNVTQLIETIITGAYTPEPLKKIEIDKPDSDEKRPIALSSIKDKLVQRTLYLHLNPYFDEQFSNKSYAYRKDKSTINAINRVSQFITEQNHHVLKADIDNFFETINHDKLLLILDKQISDKSITRLISLFLQTGGFQVFDYNDHIDGVHQGDIISPLLSNIYLDSMDKFLDEYEIPFVRYADDFVVLAPKKEQIITIKEKIEKFLDALDLKLGIEDTFVTRINDGFTFLGVQFEGKNRSVDNTRFQKSISKLYKLSKNKSGSEKYIHEINSYLFALKNYYLKIISKNSTQVAHLQNALIDSIAQKVYLFKNNKTITTKKAFKIVLEKIEFGILFEAEAVEDKINLIIAKAYEHYLSNKSYKDSKTKIDKKKNDYAKKFANDTTLHVSTPGLMLGISKHTFTLKEYGKVKKQFPLDQIKRIILEGKGYSLSSNVIKVAADNGITIDFIDRDGNQYASLITYKSTLSQVVHKQAMMLNTPIQFKIALEFIRGKAKNQINYLKYLDKYHRLLDQNIVKMQNTLVSCQTSATTVNELMGYEGSISALYWESLRLVISTPFEKRITFGAKDIVNSSLNYGYAMLYGKVQHSLVHAGLSLNISFLHSLDTKKPTLTYDMIEEFRTFVVDRTIISMLNKDEPIKLGNDGLLTKASRQLISKNIKEKLGSYTMWKKESIKVENIILTQCYALAKVVNGETPKYKAFIGKF